MPHDAMPTASGENGPDKEISDASRPVTASESNPLVHSDISPADTENSPNPSDPANDDGPAKLNAVRQEWQAMLASVPRNGDAWYVIPAKYLQSALHEQADSVEQLASTIGKLNCTCLLDQNGALYPEGSEPIPSTQIPPDLFQNLISHFGMDGTPVIRNSIFGEDGTPVLERFPPIFVIHTLTEGSVTSRFASHSHSKCSFSLSRSKTFKNLIDAINTCLFKGKSSQIRLWFISTENIEDLPPSIPVSTFVTGISEKKLVGPQILPYTLASQGVINTRIHLVAETLSKATKKYPVDSYVAASASKHDKVDAVLTSGGHLGLTNLGNTCYMNSALQCLVHLPEVNYYFFFDLYERELNRTNPLGNNGEVASAFSSLLHKLFEDKAVASSYVNPREFKYTIGRYSSMFHGYQQQDSQEFLSWLLDALHEDLNRIHNKPYLEKPELKDEDRDDPDALLKLAQTCWDQHKQRNDSIIVDLFTGLYQSSLVCPVCEKQSVTFDPFNDLTLPLPVNKKWYHFFTIVDLSGSTDRSPISKLEVELQKTSNLDDLLTYLSDFLHVPTEQLFLYEIFRNYFYKSLQGKGASKFMPISELIGEDDTIYVYIVPHDVTTQVVIPIVNVVKDQDKSYNITEPFGIPLFVTLDKERDLRSFGAIREKTEQVIKILTKEDIESAYAHIKGARNKKFFNAEDFPAIARESKVEDAVMDLDSSEAEIDPEMEGYDSDISLANPSMSASFGFKLKVYEEDPKFTNRYTNGIGRYNSSSGFASSAIKIPQGRPQFSELPLLSDRLPELKQKYYHYPDFVKDESAAKSESIEVPEISAETPVSPDASESSETGLGKENAVSAPILSDDDAESDTNWDNVNPLFASIDHLESTNGPPSDIDQSEVSDSPLAAEKVDKHPILVNENNLLVAEWDSQVYQQFFGDVHSQAWEEPPVIPNPELEESKQKLSLQQKSSISLYDCLSNFSIPEVLGDQDLWYCPRCKEHRRATKTIQLWSTGDLLTIHLKRFQSARHFSDKINMVVDFPIEGLDMTKFVSPNSFEGEELIYDLVAVDNHYGGLGGGHYTASAKNFRDGKWYYFNDSRVTPMDDPQECVTGAAYLLFYKKRTSNSFSGGENVGKLLKTGKQEYEVRFNKQRQLQTQISHELEEYYKQENKILEEEMSRELENLEKPGSADEDEKAVEAGDDEEDLYEDSVSDDAGTVQRSGSKKSRSPMAEQTMKFEFENQRKQRLISKDSDSHRSVNINMGYSSSVSNLASPTGSSEDEAS